MNGRKLFLLFAFFSTSPVQAGSVPSYLVELNKLPFVFGREYFVVRSGRTQMIVQADRVDLGPAFSYLLFDIQNPRQSINKEGAFNFVPGEAFISSALEVELGGFPFTALGHRTTTRWVLADGIPTVEAIWWAGGIQVTERISALVGMDVFLRSIWLEGTHLIGEESVRLHLYLPHGDCHARDGVLLRDLGTARLALALLGTLPANIRETQQLLEIGPLRVNPHSILRLDTILVTQVPTRPEEELLDKVQSLRDSSAAQAKSSTREHWAFCSSLSTSDSTVQEIFDKARYGLPGMMADDGTMDAGIFEYGAQWVRDTSNTTLGMIHAGNFEVARQTLERVLSQMINSEGNAMIAGGFDTPDREQFDQMGELLHVLKSYRDWTGDDSLIRNHRALLLALIERPLRPAFRDQTGMVHNRREFWERTLQDGYELAYQTWLIQGLRDSADLAPLLGAETQASRWHTEANRIAASMLSHPTRALVQDGHLVKRRNITGEIADQLTNFKGFQSDVPLNTEAHHRLFPDASMALPIALRVVDPRSELARRTLDEMEALWNTRWSDGGYDRYHTSSQPDQPGPWPFATCFILRAQHEAGLYDRSRRSLEWLNTVQGGRTGAWFEEIPSIRSLSKSCGLVQWTSAEILLFVVRHWLGVHFEGDRLVIHPALYPGSRTVIADLRFRKGRLRLEVHGSGPVQSALVNGTVIQPSADGSVYIPMDFQAGTVIIETVRSETSSFSASEPH